MTSRLVFPRSKRSVDEGVTTRHPFADLGNTPAAATTAVSTTTGASLDGSVKELTPKKPSTCTTSKKRPKSTEVMTTVKKKRTQRKLAPATNSLKDAKSELGANDGE